MPAPDNSAATPHTEAELLRRAEQLAGRLLADVAAEFGLLVPVEPLRAKGWAGALCERALGANAGSKPVPDFQSLGVELKTLPVNRFGKPLESTFVCSIALGDVGVTEWAASRARSKLQRVLWVPVLAERQIPIAERRFGSAFLWSPSPEEEAALRWDWEELAGLIGCGRLDDITGHLGRFLQVRPKAANGQARRKLQGEDGATEKVLPRGFYLRQCFTEGLISRHLILPSRVAEEA